jgi:CheY-like chemotaxis protein/DNA-binding XRE family transcriptional regulator
VSEIDVKKMFGEAVRGWRNLLGISQEELAERADLHRTYVSDVERGTRNLSLESIERLARALEISVSALFPQPGLQKNEGVGPGDGHAGDLIDILLVEDNADDVELTLHAFKKSRFANRIHVVSDGAEALDYVFCRGRFARRRLKSNLQMILLDLNLPKVSGLEVLRRIKADKRTREIPVVILTISDDHYDVAECRRLGAENYIVKPVDFQSLSQATPELNLNWVLLKPLKPGAQKVQA